MNPVLISIVNNLRYVKGTAKYFLSTDKNTLKINLRVGGEGGGEGTRSREKNGTRRNGRR